VPWHGVEKVGIRAETGEAVASGGGADGGTGARPATVLLRPRAGAVRGDDGRRLDQVMGPGSGESGTQVRSCDP